MIFFFTTRFGTFFFALENLYIFFRNFLKYGFRCNSSEIHMHNHFHFGDCALDALFLVKLAKENGGLNFYYYVCKPHIPDLALYSESKNIHIREISSRPYYSINSWKNYRFRWRNDPLKSDFVSFYINFFFDLSKKIGLNSPIRRPEDLLFDGARLRSAHNLPSYNILVVNSSPLSGQLKDPDNLVDKLAIKLAENYRVITTKKISSIECTRDYGFGLYEIGCLSKNCDSLIMISTGPSWFALNTHTYKNCKFIKIIIDNEFIEIPPVVQTLSLDSIAKMESMNFKFR